MFEELSKFITNTTDAKRCVVNVAHALKSAGFVELDEKVDWYDLYDNVKGVYVIRGGSIIAVSLPDSLTGFVGSLTHSDSPHFKIKTNPEIVQNGYTKLNVEPYGGAIYYSWLDKPLSICGTIIGKDRQAKSVDTGLEYQVFIPSQAIHINRDTNTSNSLNPQKDMLPVWALGEDGWVVEKISQLAGVENQILAYDLSLYNPEPVKKVKLGTDSVIMGPRLDNLASVYSCLRAFLDNFKEFKKDTASKKIANVFVAFNSEEIGSATFDGADCNFLTSVLERICKIYDEDRYLVFANSTFLSVDAAHAIHPNAPEKSDPTNIVKLGEGVVVKHNANYANNIELEAYIKSLCKVDNIKVQDFYSRSDMRCGATLGNISMSHHGIQTFDIGIPMLAMHSAVETINITDLRNLNYLVYAYYYHGN